MKKALVYFIIIFFAFAAHAQTTINSNITENTTWTKAKSPYVLTKTILVDELSTLTIEPGVIIKNHLQYDLSDMLVVKGTLIAQGTLTEPIVFTDIKDDNYGGDTNNDGSLTAPKRNDWGGVVLEGPSNNNSVIQHCVFRFGGYNGGALFLTGCSPTITNTLFESCLFGLHVSAAPVVHDNIFKSCNIPIRLSLNSEPDFRNNKLENNSITALGIAGGEYKNNPSYKLKKIDIGGVSNIPYCITSQFTIAENATLTIEPGVIIKNHLQYDLSNMLVVKGTLIAQGTLTEPIVFTDIKDDNYGGDSNNDGSSSAPKTNDWGGVVLEGPSNNNSVIQHCVFRFGGYNGGALFLTGCSPTITNTLFESCLFGLHVSAAPIVHDNIFKSCNIPIQLSLNSEPDLSNNKLENNSITALGIAGGEYKNNPSYKLKRIDIGGVRNIPYCITSQFTIAENATLTIEPGVIIKNHLQYDLSNMLVVKGTLIAQGTLTEPIVFTDIKDDNYGGDSNNDGSSSAPKRNDWGGVVLEGPSNNNSVIQHCVFRFGGYNGGALFLTGCSPMIKYCLFENCKNGIKLATGSDLNLSKNKFINNNNAILSYLSTSRVTIDSSEFKNNENAVYINDGFATINNSYFTDNVNYDIKNNAKKDINAQKNWWGMDIFTEIGKGNNPKNLPNLIDKFDDNTKGEIDYSNALLPPPDIYEVEPAIGVLMNKYDTVSLLAFPVHPGSKVKLFSEYNGFWNPDSVRYIDSLNLKVYLDFEKAKLGMYDIIIENDKDTLTKAKAYSLLEAETPFNEWVDFEGETGKVFASGVPLPTAERVYCLLKKSTHIDYSSTWRGGINILKNDSVVLGKSRNTGDDIQVVLENVKSGYYPFEIYSSLDKNWKGKIKFCLEPEELTLNEWNKGEILRPYGYDWKVVDVPGNVDTLTFQTEGYGLWSTIDVSYEYLGNMYEHWQFSNMGAGYRIKGKIANPKKGKYFIKYMDSAVLWEGDVYRKDQSREYFVYIKTFGSIPETDQDLTVTRTSADTLNTGISTLKIFGNGLKVSDEIQLRDESGDFISGVVYDSVLVNNYLTVGFDLTDAKEGEWYISVLRNNELIQFKNVTIFISENSNLKIDIEIISRELFRVGRFQPVIVRLSNNSNKDLHLVPITLTLPKTIKVEVRNIQKIKYDSIHNSYDPNNFDLEVINPINSNLNNINLFIPFIGTNQVYELIYWLNPSTTGTFNYELVVNIPWFNNFNLNLLKSGQLNNDCIKKCDDDFIRELPQDIWDYLKERIPEIQENLLDALEASANSWYDDWLNTVIIPGIRSTIENPSTVIHGGAAGAGSNFPVTIHQILNLTDVSLESITLIMDNLSEIADATNDARDRRRDCMRNCRDNEDLPNTENNSGEGVTSTTPEDKYGPVGASSAINDSISHHYIESSKVFEYRVDYWNKEDATAPAAIVYIRDTLDTNFNLQSFNFTEVGFLKWKVKLDGGQYFNVNVDCRPEMPYIVNIEGTVDPESREAYWVHTTLDPKTMDLPEDPMAGYLPPIDATGYQLGWVNYTIESNDSLPDGTVFKNQAFVNFDGVGKWGPAPKEGPFTNIFDLSPPTSSMHPTPLIVEADSVLLSWEGEDAGSGVQDYTIYVSEADSFYVWQSNLEDTTAYFHGENGKTYKFFSIAADRVGIIEPMKEDYEAIVTFNIPVYSSATLNNNFIEIYPNPTDGIFTVRNNCSSKIHIEVYNSLGELIYAKYANGFENQINMSGKVPGMYLVKAKCNDMVCIKKLILH